MAVYIDDFNAAHVTTGNYPLCHMCADSTIELLEFFDKIRVGKDIKEMGTFLEHAYIPADRRKQAISNGAIPVTHKALSQMVTVRTFNKTQILTPR